MHSTGTVQNGFHMVQSAIHPSAGGHESMDVTCAIFLTNSSRRSLKAPLALKYIVEAMFYI